VYDVGRIVGVQNARAFRKVSRLATLRNLAAIAPFIGSMTATRGTQDVNDPERPSGRIAGPEAGSFTSWVPLLR